MIVLTLIMTCTCTYSNVTQCHLHILYARDLEELSDLLHLFPIRCYDTDIVNG